MLEYLDKVFANRAFKARTEYEVSNNLALKIDPKRIRYTDLEMTFEKAFPRELEELREEYINLRTELDVAESDATYRAGWLDGLIVGVMAASREGQYTG